MDFKIYHRPGNSKNMAFTDYLSRYPMKNNDTMCVLNIENFMNGSITLEQWRRTIDLDEQFKNGSGI